MNRVCQTKSAVFISFVFSLLQTDLTFRIYISPKKNTLRGNFLFFFSIPLLARLYESTESYCCHFDVGIGVGDSITLSKFYVKVFMLWARHCKESYPVWDRSC